MSMRRPNPAMHLSEADPASAFGRRLKAPVLSSFGAQPVTLPLATVLHVGEQERARQLNLSRIRADEQKQRPPGAPHEAISCDEHHCAHTDHDELLLSLMDRYEATRVAHKANVNATYQAHNMAQMDELVYGAEALSCDPSSPMPAVHHQGRGEGISSMVGAIRAQIDGNHELSKYYEGLATGSGADIDVPPLSIEAMSKIALGSVSHVVGGAVNYGKSLTETKNAKSASRMVDDLNTKIASCNELQDVLASMGFLVHHIEATMKPTSTWTRQTAQVAAFAAVDQLCRLNKRLPSAGVGKAVVYLTASVPVGSGKAQALEAARGIYTLTQHHANIRGLQEAHQSYSSAQVRRNIQQAANIQRMQIELSKAHLNASFCAFGPEYATLSIRGNAMGGPIVSVDAGGLYETIEATNVGWEESIAAHKRSYTR